MSCEFCNLPQEALREELLTLARQYGQIRGMGLSLDMSRGKPSPVQLGFSDEMLRVISRGDDCFTEEGFDTRNYGLADGVPELRRIFAALLGVNEEEILLGGNSSLTLMYDAVCRAMLFGTGGGALPWKDQGNIKFLCPSPGYDRHFAISERFGIEMIPIRMTGKGPDMDEIERLVAADDSIKGIWCVPKYSNPTGITFSEDTVRRLVEMPTAAPDFRIFWDNAYCVHDLYDETDELANIFDLARAAGTEDRVVAFASTSKITFPGAGIGFIGASPAVIAEFSKRLKAGLISADKLNQLRHVRFLPTIEAVKQHMKKHAEFLRPRFEAVERKLTEGLGDTGCATWTHPRGGYFVSFDGPEGSAQKVAALCADLGVKLTPAGATWPYGKDPRDTNIRIAPSYPTVEDLEAALDVLVLAVKLVAAELARAERA